MADLARLGFVVDTGDLADAKAKLDQLTPAASRAEKATEKFNNAAAGITRNSKGAATGILGYKSAVDNAARGQSAMSQAALRTGTAMGTVQTAATGAAMGIGRLNVVAQQFGPPTAAWEAYRAALAKVPAAANGAASSLQRLGASANDNINRLQSTPGNIAAQFQDIGVTAAGGMQPYLIALQQGTQLGAAMQGGLKNLAAGLMQVLNPMSLLAIAITFVIALLIQWAMEALKAKTETDALTKALEESKTISYAFGDAQSALGGIIDLTTGKIKTQSEALWGLARAQLEVIRAQAISDKAKATRDITEVRGANRALVISGGSSIAGTGMRTAEGPASKFQNNLDTIVAGGATSRQAIDYFENLRKAGQLTEDQFIRLTTAAANLGVAGENLKVYDQAMKAMAGDAKALEPFLNRPAAPKERTGGRTRDPWRDMMEGAQNDIALEKTRAAAVGMTADAVYEMEQRTKLLNAANSAGIKLTTEQIGKINEMAAAFSAAKVEADRVVFMGDVGKSIDLDISKFRMAAQDAGLYGEALYKASKMAELLADADTRRIKLTKEDIAQLNTEAMDFASAAIGADASKFMEQMKRDAEAAGFGLARLRGEYGLGEQELATYRYETEALTRAKQMGLDKDPAVIAAIKGQAAAFGEATAGSSAYQRTLERLRDAFDFSRDAIKGFVSDLRTGLEQGKGFFSVFADAVLNVLNKVIDKLLDVAISAAMGEGTGISGFLSGLAGAFSSGGVKRAANGAIINGRTFLNHAGGTTMAGENGKEAIMPLQRGPDGALGVAVNGRGGGGTTFAPTVHVSMTFPISGAMDVSQVRQEIEASAGRVSDQVKREIPAVLAQYQTDGALA